METPVDARSLEDRVAATVGLLNVVTAELVGLVGEALDTGGWEGFGIRSPEHWVVWRAGVSPGRARRLVALARGLGSLPATRATFGSGSLSEDQAAVIVRHTDADHDRQVADLAQSLTVPQLQRVLPSLPRSRHDPDPDGPDERDETPRGPVAGPRRGVRFGFGDDGWWWCSMRLPDDEGALVQRALEVGRDWEFRLRHPHEGRGGPHDPGDVSWADGLLRLAQAGLGGLDPDTGCGRPPGERTQVILHLDADGKTPPRLHLGPVLARGVADCLSCDATVRYLLLRRGRPVAMGRRERTVTPRLRLVVEHRDGGCRVPGCDCTRWLHVHHIRHWSRGGHTDPANLCALCPVHHRMVHAGQLTITGDPEDPDGPDGLTFTDQRGRRLEPARPRPPAAGRTTTDAAGRLGLPRPDWQHPPGEPLDHRWINWN